MTARRVTWTLGLAGGLLAVTVAARAGAQPQTREATSPFADAPAVAASWRNPYEGQAEAVRAGRKLYRQHCAHCHGADATGDSRVPGLRSRFVQSRPPGVLFWVLTNGDLPGGMPSWSGLPSERRWQIITYLESLGSSSPSRGLERSPDQDLPPPPGSRR